MISVNINSDDPDDIFVTVTDQNSRPPVDVMTNRRFNHGDPAVVVNIQPDGNGHGNLTWAASRCNDPTVAKNGASQPENLDTVDVEAS